MNNQNIKLIILVPIILLISLYMGVGAASSQGEVLTITGVGVVVTLALLMGDRVWLLVPLVLFSNLFFRWIPGNLALRELAFLITIASSCLLIVGRKIKLISNFHLIHGFGILVVFCVVQGYLRHPTGLAVMGSGNVGGRPYFNFVLAVLGCVILSTISVRSRDLLAARKYATIGGVFTIVVQWIAYIPGLGFIMTIVFGTGNLAFDEDSSPSAESAGRNMAGSITAMALPGIVVAYASPLKALTANKWTIIVLFAMFGALVSGFRSRIALMVMIFAFGTFYWSGIKGVLLGSFSAVFAWLCLAVVGIMFSLPPKMQRALSFLPGPWEQRYVDEGESSTEWRVEIWEEALFTERWIKNKLLGDGLGFTTEELSMQQGLQDGSFSTGGFGGMTDHQVSILVNGDYHSGPVSLVRSIGYLGLVIFTVSLIALSIMCHRLLREYRESPYFGVIAMFLIPAIVHPIMFMFIFGGFSKDVPYFFLNLGFYSLLRNNFHKFEDDDTDISEGDKVVA